MKLSRILLPLFLLCAVPAFALTDDQVVKYIKEQSAAGKSEKQIGKELMAKGVTPEQVKRIKAKYERERSADVPAQSSVQEYDGRKLVTSTRDVEEVTVVEGRDISGLTYNSSAVDSENVRKRGSRSVYGRELFNSKSLTFEPNENMATPQNYKLGPGDEVVIDMWGNNEEHISQVISPEGSIMIAQLGPVYLNGMTINEANKYIKGVFARKYAGLGDNETEINVTLGDIRTIQVDIMGEVSTPGTFRISPFSTVFHAL